MENYASYPCRHITLTAQHPALVQARYIRFSTLSCYGQGAGLSHFAVKHGKTEIETELEKEVDALTSKKADQALAKYNGHRGKKSDAKTAIHNLIVSK